MREGGGGGHLCPDCILRWRGLRVLCQLVSTDLLHAHKTVQSLDRSQAEDSAVQTRHTWSLPYRASHVGVRVTLSTLDARTGHAALNPNIQRADLSCLNPQHAGRCKQSCRQLELVAHSLLVPPYLDSGADKC